MGDFSRRGAYERYKTTTKAFSDFLALLTPFPLITVSDLAKAADHVASIITTTNDLKALLESLNETIHLREKVGATYEKNADDGHHYIIQVLKYCRSVFNASQSKLEKDVRQLSSKTKDLPSPTSIINEDNKSYNNIEQQQYGQFYPLRKYSCDDDDDDDKNSSEDELQSIEEKVELLSNSEKYSINDDLIKGSLAFQATPFFLTAEKLFSDVAIGFERL